MYCSPSKKTKIQGSCYDNNELIAIANAYNNVIKKNKSICKDTGISKDNVCIKSCNLIDINLTSLELHKELSSKLDKLCKSDMCWTDLDFIKTIKDKHLRNSILHFTFKPKFNSLSSKVKWSTNTKTNAWFNTFNINQIMDQYQELYKDTFTFLGAQPSDYSKVGKINWDIIKKKNNIGIIFNTDNHKQPGRHWVSVFIDNVNKKVDYFDSLGNKPNKNISSFLKHFKTYNFTINNIEHQKQNENCGVYSCYFIIQRLKGLSFEQITKRIITDKMMTDYRSFLFRP